MSPDTVLSLLIEANPVPDPDIMRALPAHDCPASLDLGSETMQLIETEPSEPTSPQPSRRRWLVAAAAAAVVVLVGAIFMTRGDDPPAEPVATLPPPTQEESAEATASAYQRAIGSGDVETAIALLNPGRTDLDADRQMAEMLAVNATLGEPWTIGDCRSTTSFGSTIRVECDVVVNDPVWVELGVSELITAVDVFDDQTVKWYSFTGADFHQGNSAYADYLEVFLPTEYQAVCIPGAYDPGTINQDGGLALTAECAQAWVPLGEEVAQWIRDGRPLP